MSISLITDGMLWPRAAIVREQFTSIDVQVDDPIEILALVELDTIEVLVSVDDPTEIDILVELDDPTEIEVMVEPEIILCDVSVKGED